METFIIRLLEVFSLEYMASVILASYFIIKVIDWVNGDKVVPTWGKRTVTFVIGAMLFGVFFLYTDTAHEQLIASFFAALFLYDAAIKELLKRFNIEYRK